jgi:hypothetical protein
LIFLQSKLNLIQYGFQLQILKMIKIIINKWSILDRPNSVIMPPCRLLTCFSSASLSLNDVTYFYLKLSLLSHQLLTSSDVINERPVFKAHTFVYILFLTYVKLSKNFSSILWDSDVIIERSFRKNRALLKGG